MLKENDMVKLNDIYNGLGSPKKTLSIGYSESLNGLGYSFIVVSESKLNDLDTIVRITRVWD